MKIYIASLGEYVGKIKEDIYIRDMYISKGLRSDIASFWSLPELVNSEDIVLLKSIWGYHLNVGMFLNVLNILKDKGVRLINGYDFIVWNMYKSEYLKDVSCLVPVVPTFILDVKKEDVAIQLENKIRDISISCDSDKLVIKPEISASGFLTYLYQVGAKNEDIISSIMENYERKFIIQPYRNSVTKGEMSIISLKGEILYGIIRNPGLFSEKIPPEYIALENIPTQMFDILKNLMHYFVDKFGSVPEICRVDFVENNVIYEILEIELIDPDLYIKHLGSELKQKVLSASYNML